MQMNKVKSRRQFFAAWSLFRVDGFGPLYLQAYCHERGAMRTFAVERMEVVE